MTTPNGSPELVEGQAVPETTVNEQIRRTEAGANYYKVVDKDLTTPPGSCADGATYIVGGGGGAWAGHIGDLATAVGTNASNGWYFRDCEEGILALVQDENRFYECINATSPTTWDPLDADDADIWAGTEDGRFLTPSNIYTAAVGQALTSSATITPDGNNGFNFTLTLAHNATLANPSNFKSGQSGIIVITQDGTGSRTLAYGSNWKFPGGAPVLSTAAGAVDLLAYAVVGSTIYATLTKAYS
jgi:hypothetical protein